MMCTLLSNCESAWGIEKQQELHDAAEDWKHEYGSNRSMMQRHLKHLHLLCGDISCPPQVAIDFINKSDLIFCNNFLFGSMETTYKRCTVILCLPLPLASNKINGWCVRCGQMVPLNAFLLEALEQHMKPGTSVVQKNNVVTWSVVVTTLELPVTYTNSLAPDPAFRFTPGSTA